MRENRFFGYYFLKPQFFKPIFLFIELVPITIVEKIKSDGI